MNLFQAIPKALKRARLNQAFATLLMERLLALPSTPEYSMFYGRLAGLRAEAKRHGYEMYFVKALQQTLRDVSAEPISIANQRQHTSAYVDATEANVEAHSWIFNLFGHLLVDVFTAKRAANYIECSFQHTDLGPITLHMQKQQNPTPPQLRLEAEAKLEDLKQQVRDYLAIVNTDDALCVPLIDHAQDKLAKMVDFDVAVANTGEAEQS